jgi:hypothetical protein
MKPIVKEYVVRVTAAFLVMGSFGIGFIMGSEYGLWIGLMAFTGILTAGIILHFIAKRYS